MGHSKSRKLKYEKTLFKITISQEGTEKGAVKV